MPDRRTVKEPQNGVMVYTYDGSFEGLLCCVFESYAEKELPVDVLAENEALLLLPIKRIETSSERADRVRRSIPKRMGHQALYFVRRAFLTCHPNKDILILRFLRLGYKHGPSIMNRLTDDTVHALFTSVKLLDHEAHLYKGFVRFSEVGGVLTSTIEPKNVVLPLLTQHFCERFPNEKFLIYDKTHGMVLVYQMGAASILGVESFEQPDAGEEEMKFRELWQLFYRTIEIKERHNERCRMTHMPKRYWSCMTEFAQETTDGRCLSVSARNKQLSQSNFLPECH